MHSKYPLAALVSGALAACGGGTPEPQTPPVTVSYEAPPPAAAENENPAPTARPLAINPKTEPTPEVPAPLVPQSLPQPLTDGQIAAITDAANQAEIEQGKLAQYKSTSARVTKFAKMMIQDHTQAKAQQSDLMRRLDVTVTENQMSAALNDQSRRILDELRQTEGNEFDRAYMDVQVNEHQHVLDALDNELIPNAQNAEFRAALVEFRPQVESHLGEARDIQQILGPASGSGETR